MSIIFGATDPVERPAAPRRSGKRPVPPRVTIPGLDLLRVVGHGGMGVVYQAHDAALGRAVAVKLLHGTQFADPHAVERFRLEAQVAARLRHPGIVQPFLFGEVDGYPYLVMEFVDGANLFAATGGNPVSPSEAAAVVRAAAEAAGAAHRQGIVHRDLKPANVLFDGPGLAAPVRVTDFGMAKLMSDHPEWSVDGTVAGTPGYMAPEQCLTDGAVGPWTDVYALGAILYELLVGRLPIPADPPELYLRLAQVSQVVPPRQLDPAVPRDLESVCLRCLAKHPRDRYLTGDELAADLGRFLAGRSVAARRPGPLGSAARLVRRNPLAAGLAAAAVAGLVATTVVAVRQWQRAEAGRRAAAAAQEHEAVARRAAESAAVAARQAADAAAGNRNRFEAAAAEVNLVRDDFLADLLGELHAAGHGPAAAAALSAVATAAERRYPDQPYPQRRTRLLAGQRLQELDPPAAARLFQPLADADPFDWVAASAGFELCRALLAVGRPAEAADRAARYSARCDAAAGPADPCSLNLALVHSRALLAAGRPAEAIAVASAGRRRSPDRRGQDEWDRLIRQAVREPLAALAGPAVVGP